MGKLLDRVLSPDVVKHDETGLALQNTLYTIAALRTMGWYVSTRVAERYGIVLEHPDKLFALAHFFNTWSDKPDEDEPIDWKACDVVAAFVLVQRKQG